MAVRKALNDLVKSAARAEKAGLRARAVLLSAAGKPAEKAAKRLGVPVQSVRRWLGLFARGGVSAVASGVAPRASGTGRDERLARLEERLGYAFNDANLLRQALCHRSYANENGLSRSDSNERLEFLGDSVLGLIMSHRLVELRPGENEGGLSRLRAALVNEQRLSFVAQAVGIGEFISLGRGEEMQGGRTKSSILSDAYEAVLAAVYLDGGLGAARRLVASHFSLIMADPDAITADADLKSRLQQMAQEAFKTAPSYIVIGESGPDHEKTFEVEVRLRGEPLGRGEGRSKREAEQHAARVAEPVLKSMLERHRRDA